MDNCLAIPKSALLNRDRETSELEGAIALPGGSKILTNRATAYLVDSTRLIAVYGWQISQLSCQNSPRFLPLSGKILSLPISTRLRQSSHFASLVAKPTIAHI